MKKKLIVLCVLVVLVLGLAVNAHAAGEKISPVAPTGSVSVGSTVSVPVDISNNPGINCAEISFTYDETALEYVDYTPGKFLSKEVSAYKNPAGKLTGLDWVEDNGNNITGDGTLFTLNFKALKEASVTISLSFSNIDDEACAGWTDTFEAGSVTFTIEEVQCDHNWSDWGGNTATCTAPGKETRTCSICNKTEERDTQALGHNFKGEETVVTPATCKTEGSKTVKCTRCDATDTVAIPVNPNAHKLTKVEGKAATCKEDGVKDTWTCDNGCGKVFLDADGKTEVKDAKDTVIDKSTVPHTKPADASKIEHKDATTTEEGYDKYTCEVCGEEITDVIAKLPATGDKDDSKGNGTAPKTGDESNIALWVVLFVVCAAVVTVVATKKLRKN